MYTPAGELQGSPICRASRRLVGDGHARHVGGWTVRRLTLPWDDARVGKSDPRRLQSVGQLREHLRNEREKLDIACVAYDNGQRAAAELIAVNARLLLHHT